MQLLIFDLDGTLIDSRLDLANAVNAEVDQSVQAAVLAAAKCFASNGATVSDT